jgi:hypothetical protein
MKKYNKYMGNLVSMPLKAFLSKYTYNFQIEKMNLSILKGKFQLENLIINDREVNALLAKMDVPLRLKFGVLKKFNLKLSIFSAKLETLEVEDLIIILGPSESLEDKFEGDEEQKMYGMILKNYIAKINNSKKGSYMNPNEFIEKERKRKLKKLEKVLKRARSKEKKEKKKKSTPPKDPNERISLLGAEIYLLIRSLLDCRINIHNVLITYEDNLDFLYSQEKLTSFNVALNIKQLNFFNDVITKYTDNYGVFKNVMNISAFLQKSGTWSLSEIAYWSMTLGSLNFSFTIGNPFLITDQVDNMLLNLELMESVYKKFEETLRINQENAFNVYNMSQVVCDFIIFYKKTMKIPIHAIFMFFDFGNITSKIEIHKMAILMDVVSHFQMMALSKQFELIRPKFRIL